MSVSQVCRVEGCGRPKYLRKLCRTHYNRDLAGLEVDGYEIEERNPGRGCFVETCTRKHHSKGLCYKHYLRSYQGVALTAPEPDPNLYRGRKCLVSDCDNEAGAIRGLCKWHGNWSGKYRFSVAQTVHILNSPHPCDICGVPLTLKSINVDHDHECCQGQQTCGDCIRGLLCRACNRAIGSFSESVDNLNVAVGYLLERSVSDSRGRKLREF